MNSELNNTTLAAAVAHSGKSSYAAKIGMSAGNSKAAFLATENDLAWAAGFLDGEACLSCVWQRYTLPNRRPTVRIRLSITQNDLSVLEKLKDILDESCIIQHTKRQRNHSRQVYVLSLDGIHALKAIIKVFPFLFRKKAEAKVLIESVKDCWFGVRPGKKGYPQHVWDARSSLVEKLQNLK